MANAKNFFTQEFSQKSGELFTEKCSPNSVENQEQRETGGGWAVLNEVSWRSRSYCRKTIPTSQKPIFGEILLERKGDSGEHHHQKVD
jgi:hypothetical protein